MSRRRIVVAGGGLAGLSAAVAAVDAGADVTVVEARTRLGGAAGSFRRHGLTVDTGQHVFLRCCTAYRSFLRRLGTAHLAPLQPRLAVPVLAEGGRQAWLRRSSLPAPLHLAGAVARYPYLSVRERATAARTARTLARLDRHDPALDSRTVGDWLLDHGESPRSIARFWDLFLLSTLNLPAAQASLALAVMVLQTGLLERADAGDLGIPRVPLDRLHAEPAVAAIAAGGGRVHTGVRVTGVHSRAGATGGAERDAVEVELSDGGRLTADALVVATPPDAAAGLLPALDGASDPTALGATPIVNVHVLYDRRVTDLEVAAGIDTPVQWLFDRTAASGYTGGQYLAVSVSAATREAGERTAVVVERYVDALARLLPGARAARVRDAFVTRERTATFRQGPGSAALRPSSTAAGPGVYLAGTWTDTGWPATMEGAVRSGRVAAAAALSDGGALTAPTTEVAA